MFDITGEEARLLLNIALMSIGQNRFGSAAKILAALGRFRPDEPSLAVANTILLISKQDFQGAVDFVDRVALPRFPDSPMLQTFKGLALIRLDRRADAAGPLEAAANQSADEAAAQLAKELLK